MKYKPMLCKQGDMSDLNNSKIFVEPKLDGTRCLLYKKGKNIKLINRRGINIIHRYKPEIENIKKGLKSNSIITDGEIIVYNKKGLPDFQLLQEREHITSPLKIELRALKNPATYVVFDILELNGKKLINLPLKKRKQILKKVVKENKNLELIFSTKQGKKLFEIIRKQQLEGIVAKKINSKYLPGIRSDSWLKIKNLKTIDAVVVGYTSEIRKISALALGVYEGNKLIYVGKVGIGFSEKFLDKLFLKLKKLKTKKIPVINPPENIKINWVKLKLIVEVKYLEFTKDNELRMPVFLRLRDDKSVKECVR